MRRGELAISVVIIIALGLLVLLILGVTLGRGFSNFSQAASACEETYQGTCMAKSLCQANGGAIVSGVSCSASHQQQNGNWVTYTFPQGGTVCCKN